MEAKQDGLSPGLVGMSKSQLYDIMSQMKALIEQNRRQAREILVQNPALTRALFQFLASQEKLRGSKYLHEKDSDMLEEKLARCVSGASRRQASSTLTHVSFSDPLFQKAQIMLGMVQSPHAAPSIPSTLPNLQPSAIPAQQSSIQPPAQVGPNQIRKQQPSQTTTSNHQSQPVPRNPLPQSKLISPPNSQPQSMSSHLSHISHQPSKPLTSQPSLIPMTQSSQFPSTQLPQHSTTSQPLSHHQPPMPSLSTQLQQPIQNIGGQYFPLQPPLPPQARPHMPTFPHHMHAQMGPNSDFQHPSGPQMHPSQHMYNTGTRPPSSLGPSFPQGQLPHSNQPLLPSVYQAGGPHYGMEFNKVGSSSQPDRGSNWMSGAPENAQGSSSQLQGPSSFAGQMGPGNYPPARPPAMSPDMEKALLQQVMSLTPEQINMLPTEQRNQILQLQQMLRQ